MEPTHFSEALVWAVILEVVEREGASPHRTHCALFWALYTLEVNSNNNLNSSQRDQVQHKTL